MKEKIEDAFLWCMLPVSLTAAIYNRIIRKQERFFLEREVARLEYENHQLRTDLRYASYTLSEMQHRETRHP